MYINSSTILNQVIILNYYLLNKFKKIYILDIRKFCNSSCADLNFEDKCK